MKNGEAKVKFWIVRLQWELFLLFPFFIFHSSFLILGAFVSSWQEPREEYGLIGIRVVLVVAVIVAAIPAGGLAVSGQNAAENVDVVRLQ